MQLLPAFAAACVFVYFFWYVCILEFLRQGNIPLNQYNTVYEMYSVRVFVRLSVCNISYYFKLIRLFTITIYTTKNKVKL